MKHWYYPIVRVEQGDNHGCGVAAVATLCGITYERARAECFPGKRKFDYRDMMVTANQMQRACTSMDIATSQVDWDTDFRIYKRPAILTLSWNPGYDNTMIHCVVWSPFGRKNGRRIIDPGWDNRKDDAYLGLARRSGYAIILATGRISAQKQVVEVAA